MTHDHKTDTDAFVKRLEAKGWTIVGLA